MARSKRSVRKAKTRRGIQYSPEQLKFRQRLQSRRPLDNIEAAEFSRTHAITVTLPSSWQHGPKTAKVFLVGTHHYDQGSADEAASLIDSLQPDALVLELCEERRSILRAVPPRTAAPTPKEELGFRSWLAKGKSFLLEELIRQTESKLRGIFDIVGGREFFAAAEAAKAVSGCRTILGDLPISETKRGLLATLSRRDLVACLRWLAGLDDGSIRTYLRQLRDDHSLTTASLLSDALQSENSGVHSVLLNRRNEALAEAILNAAYLSHTKPSPSAAPHSPVIVAVVGRMHLPGLLKQLQLSTQDFAHAA